MSVVTTITVTLPMAMAYHERLHECGKEAIPHARLNYAIGRNITTLASLIQSEQQRQREEFLKCVDKTSDGQPIAYPANEEAPEEHYRISDPGQAARYQAWHNEHMTYEHKVTMAVVRIEDEDLPDILASTPPQLISILLQTNIIEEYGHVSEKTSSEEAGSEETVSE